MSNKKLKKIVLQAQNLFFKGTILSLFSIFCFVQYNITSTDQGGKTSLKIKGNSKTLEQPIATKESKLIRLNHGIIAKK